jgi:hypothetical protein
VIQKKQKANFLNLPASLCYTTIMKLESLSTTQLFELLVGGGILAIVLIGLVAIIFRRRDPPGGG